MCRPAPGGPLLAAAWLGVLLVWAAEPSSARRPREILSVEQWRLALAEHGVERPDLRSPIETDEELRQAAKRIAASGPGPGTMATLRTFQDYLFDRSEFSYDYYAGRTLTAVEAFRQRRGNCVSSTNLFIAMGRALGLPVQAALARVPRDTETVGDLVVVNSHVVAVVPWASGRVVFDFDQNRRVEPVQYRIIGDLELTAVYLNNLGAERLIADDPAEAITYFEDAIRMTPSFAAAHRNLGVALQRSGDLAGSLDATLLSLYYEPDNLSTRNNLLGLFGAEYRATSAAGPAPVDSPVAAALAEGDLALSQGKADLARKHYQRARELDPADPDAHVALARVQLFKGRLRGGVKRLAEALRLDPEHGEARRLLRGLGRE